MFDEPFRRRLAPLLRPVVATLARAGVGPNQVTILTFVMALVSAALVALGWPGLGVGLWLTSRLGDALDGALARRTGGGTPFGGYLDITLDMAAYSAMVIGFAATAPALWLAWLAILAGYVMAITTTLALSDALGKSGRDGPAGDRTFRFTPGIAEAGETSVMYALWAMFPQHLGWLTWLWAAALAATAIQRTWLAARALR
jgi:phosphatidylglycerophosphate synthase